MKRPTIASTRAIAWRVLSAAPIMSMVGCGGAGSASAPDQAASDGATAVVTDAQGSSASDAKAGTLSDASTPGASDDGPTNTIVTLPLTGCADNGYAAGFTIGGQRFDLIVDTGSGTLAVASDQCPTCGVTPTYSPGATAIDQRIKTSNVYGAGSWVGEVYSDEVNLIGFVPTVSMKIAGMRSQSQFFSDAGCGLGAIPFAPQGIVGFGPADLAGKDSDAFLAKLAEAGARSGLFAVELCPSGGQLMMGGVDPDGGAATGPFVFTPMAKSIYYSVTLSDLQLAAQSAGFGPADFGTTIVDTGSTQLALPTAVYNAVSSTIENAPAFATAFGTDKSWFGRGDCSTSSLTRAQLDAQLPALTLVFPDANGGTGPVTFRATDSYLPAINLGGSTYYCSSIGASPSPAITILGDAVLSAHLVVFDTEKRQIGFAPQSYCR